MAFKKGKFRLYNSLRFTTQRYFAFHGIRTSFMSYKIGFVKSLTGYVGSEWTSEPESTQRITWMWLEIEIFAKDSTVKRCYAVWSTDRSASRLTGQNVKDLNYPLYDFDLRAKHARTLLPGALASV
jgi:hypothetical protein